MRTLQVHINGFVMYEEQVPAGHSLMRGQQLVRMWCIEKLCENGISAGVAITREDGTRKAITQVEYSNGSIIAQSAMNAEGFEEKPEWWDDIFNQLPIKNEHDET